MILPATVIDFNTAHAEIRPPAVMAIPTLRGEGLPERIPLRKVFLRTVKMVRHRTAAKNQPESKYGLTKMDIYTNLTIIV